MGSTLRGLNQNQTVHNENSGSGDMTETVTYTPTLPGEKKLSIEPMKRMLRERHYHTTRWIKTSFLLFNPWKLHCTLIASMIIFILALTIMVKIEEKFS